MLEFDRLSRRYGETVALESLSFTVQPGQMFGFVGANGAGKTTAMRIALGVLGADAGEVRWMGRPVTFQTRRSFGYMPEERGLYPKMRVAEHLVYLARLHGLDPAAASAAADRWTERLGIAERRGDAVEKLSLGNQQRVQLAAALVHDPDVLILDEPFSGLDPVNADVLKDAVLELRKAGTTVVFSTHDMGVAERMCDFIFMIHRGRKVLDGTLDAIQDAHGSDTIRVRLDGADDLTGLPGVSRVTDFGKFQELQLGSGADPKQILAALIGRGTVRHFELARPSLQEIFVRIARPEGGGNGHA